MKYGKWIGGALGWIILGPMGGILGFIIGGLADRDGTAPGWIGGSEAQQSSSDRGAYNKNRRYTQEEQRNSFLMSFMVLSMAVIKADGRFLKSELEFVKDFIRRNFGEQALVEAMDIMKDLKDKEINVNQVGRQIETYMNYSQRMQLFHYLVALSQADGEMAQSEVDVLRTIATSIGLKYGDVESILSMFKDDLESAYRVLEISSDATDEEVKKAYKSLAIKHHPDKVASLGPDVQKAAEEKFKNIQSAYEKIKKARCMS